MKRHIASILVVTFSLISLASAQAHLRPQAITYAPRAQRLTVTVTSAEIQNLLTTSMVLVPSPGAGKFICVRNLIVKYIFGTTIYDGNAEILVSFPYSLPLFSQYATDFMLSNHNEMAVGPPLLMTDNFPQFDVINQPVVVSARGVPLTGGDGSLVFVVDYTVETF